VAIEIMEGAKGRLSDVAFDLPIAFPASQNLKHRNSMFEISISEVGI